MWSQILIAVSMAVAGVSDIRERSVHDIAWFPAAVGIIYILIFRNDLLLSVALKVAIIGGIAIGFTLYGALGQADAIALVVLAFDPYLISPLLIFVAAASVALMHIAYIFISKKGGTKVITIEQFKMEEHWIPRAIIVSGKKVVVNKDVNKAREEVLQQASEDTLVEVTYGVPTVAYLAAGYISYLVYLALFNYSTFLSLP